MRTESACGRNAWCASKGPMLYPAPELPDDTPIDNVRFSTRIRNAVTAAGWKTVGEIREASDATLLGLHDPRKRLGHSPSRDAGPTFKRWRATSRAEGQGEMTGPGRKSLCKPPNRLNLCPILLTQPLAAERAGSPRRAPSRLTPQSAGRGSSTRDRVRDLLVCAAQLLIKSNQAAPL